MKGISARLALVLALAFGASSSAVAFNPFGLFGNNDQPNLEGLLASVPADTVFFVGGSSDQAAAGFFENWVPGTGEADLEELAWLLEGEQENPSFALMMWLMSDYLTTATEGYQALYNRYGISTEADALFYLHGAIPVLRFSLSDSDQMKAVLDQAELETGATSRQYEIDGVNIRAWALTDEFDDFQVELAALVHQDVLTLSVLIGGESQSRHAQRFGLAEMPNSMAAAGIWDELGQQYSFDDQMRGYLSLSGIAEGFLGNGDTSLGQDLRTLVPDLFEERDAELSQACRAEWLDLARQSPRLVFGTDQFNVSGDVLSQSVRMIWELTNPEVTGALSKLPGSLPAYSLDASDKLMAFALGLDVNALAPVATELWTLFTQADFECEQLIEMQQQAQSVSPAMVGMVSGMAQGVKGLGIALYSLTVDQQSPLGVQASVLVTLSAESPQTLAPLITSSIPGMAGVRIPTNGDAVSLPLPGVPLDLFAAIKGKHLVVYSGPEGEAAANAMASEPLNTDGVTALALNYQETGNSALKLLNAAPDLPMNPMLMTGDFGSCDQAYVTALQLSQLPMKLSYKDTFNSGGWEALVSASVTRQNLDQAVNAGTYQVQTLNYDCSWLTSGQETLNADGSGQYSEQDPSGQCDLYQLDYSWSQEGLRLTQQASAERGRDTCTEEWEAYDAESYVCHLMGTHDNGFYCLYYFDSEPSLMRYSR